MKIKLVTQEQYENGLYEVIQDHTTQADWQPSVAASLWRVYTPNETPQGTEIIPDFVQPVSTNPYMTGDKVVFEGMVYESTIDDNVRSPYRIPSRGATNIINMSNGGGIWKFKAIIYQ